MPFWLWSLPLSLIAFFVAKAIATRLNKPLLNPLLLAILIIIPLLLITHTSYEHYFRGSHLLNDLLQPAVVALAYPLYELLATIRQYWRQILLVCLLGCVSAMISGTTIALFLGATPEIAASVLPKSVTTPIAMATASLIHGIPSVTAVCVLFVGILGASLGHFVLDWLKISSTFARGLTMGTISHALGTARCSEINIKEGAFSSLALVLCGIMTSLLAPVIAHVLL